MKVEHYTSPNHDSRKGKQPFIFVVHYTGSLNVAGTLDWFSRSESKVSAHEVIDFDGTRYLVVPKSERAWHARTICVVIKSYYRYFRG